MNLIAKRVLVSVLVLSATPAFAGLFRFESETLFTDRQDAYLNEQLPILESIQSSYVNDKSNADFNTNFSFFADPAQGDSEFLLHALSFGFKPTDSVEIQVGRRFNTYFLVRAATTDTVSISIKPFSRNLTFTAYGGRLQQTEVKDVNIETDLSGGSIQYQTSGVFPFKIQTAYEHLNYTKTDTFENIGKVSLVKQFESWQNIELSGNEEMDLDVNEQNRLDLGARFYPSIYTNWNLRYSQYELTALSGWEDPISTIFSQGRIDEVAVGITQAATSQLSYSFEMGADQYLLGDSDMTDGQRAALDINYKTDGGVILANQLMMILSYGGKVWADIFQIEYPLFAKTNLVLNNEFVTYEKVTASKREAISTQVGIGTWVWGHLKMNLLAEYNSNNFVHDEFRIIGQLLAMEWVEL